MFEESAVPEVYFVTLAGADLVAVAPGGSLTFNVGVLAATNTGLPITFARVSGSLPPGTSLNASTGLISGAPTTAGLYTFTIRATSGGQTGEQTYSILVNAASAPRVSFAAVAQQDYVAGTYVGLNLAPSVTVENSSGVPVFDIQGGSLPPGLTLSTGGVVFGTPTGYGPYAAQIRAIIPTGQFDIQTIAFDAAVPTIASNGLALQNYTVDAAYSLDLATLVDVANTTADPTFALVLGSLPAGLTLTDGAISGTPTAYGAYAATFSATLPSGQSTEVTVALFQQNPDDLPDAVILGGTAQTWLESSASGSTTYDAADFTASGVLTVLEAGWVEYILVGGGAGGASVSSTAGGGGGGAGGFRRERIYLNAGTHNVSIGSGGGPGLNGTGSSFTDGLPLGIVRTVQGGGRGASTNQAGGNGASGGGGGGGATTGGAGGTGNSDFGTNGGGGFLNSTAGRGGGGGGFSVPGSTATSGREGNGGGGIRVKLWTMLEFCGGGGGGGPNGSTGQNGNAWNGAGSGGNGGAGGGNADPNTGSGGGGAGGGPSGSRTGGAGGSGRAIFIVKRRTA
ncbi:MAG: Ig domain-containing protein [Alphaproteobacteria bacterium]